MMGIFACKDHFTKGLVLFLVKNLIMTDWSVSCWVYNFWKENLKSKNAVVKGN